MLRVVFDTNVFVSSLLVKKGRPAQALDAWRERRYVLITSPTIIAEIRATLQYPRIRRKYPVADEDINALVTLLEQDALLTPGAANVADAVPADPADGIVLACALDAQADLIVSGDHHLLEMGVYRGIPILTVHEFLERLAAEERG